MKDVERLLPAPQPNQPDPIQMMQMQAMQTMSEAEKMASEAKMIQAQASMLDSQVKMQKLSAEIDKLEAESMKLLSDVDKNEQQTALAIMKENRDNMAQHLNHNMELLRDHNKRRDAEDAHRRSKELAQESSLQNGTAKLDNAMHRATPRVS